MSHKDCMKIFLLLIFTIPLTFPLRLLSRIKEKNLALIEAYIAALIKRIELRI